MKHTLKTTLALLFAGVIHLSAQTHDAAIDTLKATEGFQYTSPAAIALKDQILAESAVSEKEATFVIVVVNRNDGTREAREAALTALAAKGSIRSQALLKVMNRSNDGWTPDMVILAPEGACRLAMADEAPEAFRLLVFDTLRQTDITAPPWQAFFKKYRSGLPKAQQVAVTAALKDRLIARSNRGDAANAFLASLSADLVALQLDQ